MLLKNVKWHIIFGLIILTSLYILFFKSISRTISHIVGESQGQSVISFSLFNRTSSLNVRYIPGLMENYWKMKELYPGWIMRVYTNVDNLSSLYNQADLYFYDTKKLSNLRNMSEIVKTVWRFLPIGDSTVDIFISRDLDSLIGDRERAAVAEWENSTTAIFHSMRDHPGHGWSVLAGMWGAKNYMLNFTTREYLQNEFVKNREQHQDLLDRLFFHNSVFNFIDSFMSHDSFYCEYFNNTIPFPTQRKTLSDFVGNYAFGRNPLNVSECPVKCRPTYGKDWVYC